MDSRSLLSTRVPGMMAEQARLQKLIWLGPTELLNKEISRHRSRIKIRWGAYLRNNLKSDCVDENSWKWQISTSVHTFQLIFVSSRGCSIDKDSEGLNWRKRSFSPSSIIILNEIPNICNGSPTKSIRDVRAHCKISIDGVPIGHLSQFVLQTQI